MEFSTCLIIGLNRKYSSNVGNYFVCVEDFVFEIFNTSFMFFEFRNLFLLAIRQVFFSL